VPSQEASFEERVRHYKNVHQYREIPARAQTETAQGKTIQNRVYGTQVLVVYVIQVLASAAKSLQRGSRAHKPINAKKSSEYPAGPGMSENHTVWSLRN
jgi:hypothetical protein